MTISCPRLHCHGWLLPSEDGGFECALCSRHFGLQHSGNGEFAAMMAEAPDTPPSTTLGRFEEQRQRRGRVLPDWWHRRRFAQHREDIVLAEKLAEEFGHPLTVFQAQIHAQHHPELAHCRRQFILALSKAGLSILRIAEVMNRHERTIQGLLKRAQMTERTT